MDQINKNLKTVYTNKQIQELQREKITVIAELFQLLEWAHPFPDGQGRVDLVLLAKLLTEQGFNPSVLQKPYFSSTSLPNEWENYLSEGMKCWREKITDKAFT